MYLQLPLPSDVHRNVTVTFVPLRTSDPFACEALETIALAPQLPKILRLQVHRKAKMQDLIAVAAEAVGVSPDCIIASDVYKNKVRKHTFNLFFLLMRSLLHSFFHADLQDVRCNKVSVWRPRQ